MFCVVLLCIVLYYFGRQKKLSEQMKEVTVKRRSARLSAKYRRQSTEQSETKMGSGQSQEDKMDTVGVSSDEPIHRLNTDARKQPQFPNECCDSIASDLQNVSSEQVMEEETRADGSSPQSFLDTPPSPQNSAVEEIVRVEQEGKK